MLCGQAHLPNLLDRAMDAAILKHSFMPRVIGVMRWITACFTGRRVLAKQPWRRLSPLNWVLAFGQHQGR